MIRGRIRAIRANGFTLVELLVAMAIIGVLASIMIPAIQSARAAARKSLCSNNLRQIGIGLANFEAAHGRFPAGQTWVSRQPPDNVSYAWSARLLGFIEQQSTYDGLDFDKSFLHPTNLTAASEVIPIYLCPSTGRREKHRGRDDRLATTPTGQGVGLACLDYLGIAGPSKDTKNPALRQKYGAQRGVLIGTKGLPRGDVIKSAAPVRERDISDGLTHTACVTECSGRGLDSDGDYHGAWVAGKNIGHISKGINSSKPPKAWTEERIYSRHPSGAHFLMCDASVHFLANGTDQLVIAALCSRDGEEFIDTDEL